MSRALPLVGLGVLALAALALSRGAEAAPFEPASPWDNPEPDADPFELWGPSVWGTPDLLEPAQTPAPDYTTEFDTFTDPFMGEGAVNYSNAAIAAVKREEGFSAKPYRDAGGYSIGYGHYMGASPDRDSITEADAEQLLIEDMNVALATVALNVRVPLTQNQLDALVSMAYNIGPSLFRNANGSRTGIWRALDAGDYAKAADEMLRWNKSEGVTLPVLSARRERERALFLS